MIQLFGHKFTCQKSDVEPNSTYVKKFNLWNNITGWITFIIASTVYLLTIEPSASFWDCGEFISTAYKLEVGHPPGAPLFMIIGRFFSLFASDPAHAAKMINSMSALASGATVMFLYWTIVHLAKKVLIKEDNYTTGNILAVFGSGLVGALAYTFTDSGWFSAVEGEVYGMSSLFTAVVFWAILKWENVADQPGANRWIILIAYLMGLSIGVHLLNLLTIPAIVLVYYFRKYKVTTMGIVYALIISVLLLAVVMYVIIQGFVNFFSYFELLFVNTFGLPYNSGIIFFALLLIAAMIYGIHYTHKNQKVVLNMIILSFTVIIIGYSSFAMIVIRSNANPPMDENNPSTIFELLSYLNREQYGDRPLLKGQYYNAPILGTKEGRPTYRKIDGKYKVIDRKAKYVFDENLTTFFPRMYSNDPEHIQAYETWVKIKGKPVRVQTRSGETQTLIKPSFGTNLAFFFKYQVGYMYLRYFMWNFSGRQNDTQGYGGVLNGNWITGIKFLDEMRLGNLDKYPERLMKQPSRNVYYMLPLLLGIVGFLYHYQKDRRNFFVILMLFIMTGLAIVVYLNQKPLEPRERDYSYAGSFYAFSVWIGLGVLYLFDMPGKKLPAIVRAIAATIIGFLLVPLIMARENWDDHDRSGRYTARDIAYDYLNTCAPNAILFTNGDNDTFPLWYAQEVEGIRTDVRVINLMLFNTEWYIDQMKRAAYESKPIPLTLPNDKYKEGTNNIIYMIERIDNFVNLKQVMDFIANEDPRTKFTPQPGMSLDYIPTKKFRLPVDAEKVISNGTVKAEDANLIVPSIDWTISRNNLMKSAMMTLDILASGNWDRPIYFVAGGNEGSLNLEDYFQDEGFAYRLVPIKTSGRNFLTYGRIDTDILYDHLMNKFSYGRMAEPDVYLDFYNVRTLSVVKLRNSFTRLANALISEGKTDSARMVLDRCMHLMPEEKVPYDFFVPSVAEAYYRIKDNDKANQIIKRHVETLTEDLVYYFSLEKQERVALDYEIRLSLQFLQNYLGLASQAGQTELNKAIDEVFMVYSQRYMQQNQPAQ